MASYEVSFVCDTDMTLDDLSIVFYETVDGVVAIRDDQVFATVEIEATNGLQAGLDAAELLRSAAIHPRRVDRDLVDATEIASRVNRSRQNVQQWATGARKDRFPRPFAVIGQRRVWTWADVAAWANQHVEGFDEPWGLTQHEAVRLESALCNSVSLPVDLSWSASVVFTGRTQVGSAKAPARYKQPVVAELSRLSLAG